MKLRPLGSRVLVKLDPREQITEGGIHVPDKYQPSPLWGEVVAVGPGNWLDNGKRDYIMSDFYVGQRVLVGPWNGVRLDTLLSVEGLEGVGFKPEREVDSGLWVMNVESEREFRDIYAVEDTDG